MLEEGNIKKVMAILNNLSGERKDYLNKYLRNAPSWYLESMEIVQKDKNNIFIEEGTDVKFVYVLIEGIVRAIDYRIFGIVYDYIWFDPIKTFGAMEILLKFEQYKTTLMTVTPCTMIKISRSKYETWMLNDMNALHMEIEDMGKSLLEQARKERVFLFLQGMDRIIYLFMDIYEKSNVDNQVVINQTRKEISERTGLSVKTINRSISKMEENGYIIKKGTKISIFEKEYKKIKEYLSPIVDEVIG